MTTQHYLTILLIAAIVGAIFTIGSIIYFKRKEDKKKTNLIIRSSKQKSSSSQFYLTSYNKLSKVPFVGSLLQNVRRRIETVAVYDDLDVRREVMKLVYRFLGIVAAVLILLIIIRPGWLILFWCIVGLVFLSGLLMDHFVVNTEMKLLKQLQYYNSRIRHYYQQFKIIDEAAYESIADVGPEMKPQATKIHEILMSVNPDEERAKYDEVAPTRFLKILANLMVMVKDKGDKVDSERGSAFNRGIGAITSELNMEILYRSRLLYKMRFFAGIAMAPIFFTVPLQRMMVGMFPILQRFYESRTGLIAALVIYAASIGTYFLIRKLKNVSENQYVAKNNDKRIEKWALAKIPGLEKLMIAIGPKYGTKTYAARFQLLKDANDAPHVTWLTLRQSFFAVATVIALIILLIIGHQREAHSTLNTILPESLASGKITEEEYEEYVAQYEFDREFIKDLQQRPVIDEAAIKEELMIYFDVDEITHSKVTNTYKRVMNKFQIVENAYLKFWEVLIVILVAAVIWFIPIWLLYFKRNLRLKDMENEVHQFLTIISILREFDNVTVYLLLQWLENFAITFKAPLQVAIQDFESGQEESLNQLSNNTNFDAFKQLIERMQLAVTRLSVSEAFEDIEIEREYFLEQRKEFNERSIDNKAGTGILISWVPFGLLLLLYFLGPILYISIKEMSNLLSSL